MNLLEVEPESCKSSCHREQLAVLVASGQTKEMLGVDLTQDQVKNLNAGEVEKYFKRYEALLSSKTCNAIGEIFLELSCKIFYFFFC